MEKISNEHNRTGALKALLTTSSVLGIAGYFLYNETFFLVASGICAALLFVIVVLALLSTPPAILPLYLVYAVLFALLLVIGCLVDHSIGRGLLLGCAFIGLCLVLMSRLVEYVHRRIDRSAPQWFDPDYDPVGYDEDENHEEKPILLDESASQEQRIRAMSKAFGRMTDIIGCLSDDFLDLRDNEGTLEALSRYMDSGLWKQDFEAAEAGMVNTEETDVCGVLSEDGLYNLLEDAKELLEDLGSLDRSFGQKSE